MGDWAYRVIPVVAFLPIMVAICTLYLVRKKDFAEFKERLLKREGRAYTVTLPGREYVMPQTSNALPMSYEQWLDAGCPNAVWFTKTAEHDIEGSTEKTHIELANRILYFLAQRGAFATRRYPLFSPDTKYQGFEYQGCDFLVCEGAREHLVTGEKIRVMVVGICAMILEVKNDKMA